MSSKDSEGESGSDDAGSELRYLPVPVKTEIEELSPVDSYGEEDDIGDHFLLGLGADTGGGVKQEPDSSGDNGNHSGDDYSWNGGGGARKARKNSKSGKTKGKSTKRKSESGGYRKPRVSEMTPEQRKLMQAKWREEARQRRARKRGELEGDGGQVPSNGSDEETGEVPKRVTRGSSGRKRRVDEMTPEEREETQAKWREEGRQKRARKSAVVKVEVEDGGSDGEDFKDTPTKTRRRLTGKRSSRKKNGEGQITRIGRINGRKRRVSEMTPEQQEIMKAKWREEARLKRARQRENQLLTMTPEEIEEKKRQEAEKKRIRRARLKENMTEEQKAEQNRRSMEYQKFRRATMTPEQKREQAQRRYLRHLEREVAMSGDEDDMKVVTENGETVLRKRQYRSRTGTRTPEQLEALRLKERQRAQRKRAQMTAEDMERRRQRMKAYRDNLSPEKKVRFLGQLTNSYKRRMARLKQDPEKWEEMKAKWREDRIKRKAKLEALGIKAPPAKRKPGARSQPARKQDPLSDKRCKLKRRLKLQKLMESGLSMEEIQSKMEKPEQRERRLIRARVNKAKWLLRRQLQSAGASAEEIETRLEELAQTYQPTRDFRPYKPRPNTWKPIPVKLDAEEVRRLEEEAIQVTNLQQPSPPKKPRKQETTPSPAKSAPRSRKKTQAPTPPSNASMADSSASSYISAVENAGPSHYLTPQQHYSAYQPGFLYQQPHSSQQLHHHRSYPHSGPSYPHLQPQTAPLPHYSLQHILDGITYHESGGVATSGPVIAHNVVTPGNYPHPPQNYHNDSSYDTYSAPASPASSGVGEAPQDFSSSTFLPSPPKRGRGRPRKDAPPHPQPPKIRLRRPKQSPANGVVCDECGGYYSRCHIREHKIKKHYLRYKDGACEDCGEKFPRAREWYTHYNRVHYVPDALFSVPVPAAKPKKPSKHICDVCGEYFSQAGNLQKHHYYQHGEGLNKDKYVKCPVCPNGRSYKLPSTLQLHLKKCHPDYKWGGHDCFRCEESFETERKLGGHVKEVHPDSYFPCEFCNACKFTQAALRFHYLRCFKIGTEKRREIHKEQGPSVDSMPLPCEFCERKVSVGRLTRHYWEVHGVKEAKFRCEDCGKDFKTRQFWASHMEERHQKPLEVTREVVRRLNVETREGLVIREAKARAGTNMKGKGKRERKGKKKRGRDEEKEEEEEVDSGSSETTSESEEEVKEVKKKKKGRRRRRRNIVVICEEDELEEGKGEDDGVVEEEDCKRKTRGKKVDYKSLIDKMEGSGEEEMEEKNSDSDEEGSGSEDEGENSEEDNQGSPSTKDLMEMLDDLEGDGEESQD